MLKIKVYDQETEIDLENKLNNLMKQLDEHEQEVIDIKYSTSCAIDRDEQIYVYSALVMYDDKIVKKNTIKKYEIVEKIGEIDE